MANRSFQYRINTDTYRRAAGSGIMKRCVKHVADNPDFWLLMLLLVVWAVRLFV